MSDGVRSRAMFGIRLWVCKNGEPAPARDRYDGLPCLASTTMPITLAELDGCRLK